MVKIPEGKVIRYHLLATSVYRDDIPNEAEAVRLLHELQTTHCRPHCKFFFGWDGDGKAVIYRTVRVDGVNDLIETWADLCKRADKESEEDLKMKRGIVQYSADIEFTDW